MYSGADTGFSSGGGQIGREAPEKNFVPPLSSSGGGQTFRARENQPIYNTNTS